MSAAELRQAAETLRVKAEAATVAPWEYEGGKDGDGLVWANRLGDPVSGSTLTEDADYIATMHPGVGLALADWLEQVAEIRADGEALLGSTQWVTDRDRLPIALARLINGGAP